MKLIDKFRIKPTHLHRYDDFDSKNITTYMSDEIIASHPVSDGYITGYVASISAEITYSCPARDHVTASKVARNTLFNSLFSEQVGMLHRLETEIFNGDRNAALRVCKSLHDSFKGE